MIGLSLGFGLSAQRVVASGGGGTDVWPLTGMGAETDWAFGGPPDGAIWNGTVVVFDAADTATAELTGSAKTAFDAAVSNSTACSVTVTVAGYGEGSIEIRMKGGSWVDMTLSGDGPATKTITSGTGSGFEMRTLSGTACTLSISDVEIIA